MDKVNMLIDALKAERIITPLEKDILDTWNELNKNPFSIESAEKQVAINNVNHKDIFYKIAALPTTAVKLRSAITEADIRYNLINQLNMLVDKEFATGNNCY